MDCKGCTSSCHRYCDETSSTNSKNTCSTAAKGCAPTSNNFCCALHNSDRCACMPTDGHCGRFTALRRCVLSETQGVVIGPLLESTSATLTGSLGRLTIENLIGDADMVAGITEIVTSIADIDTEAPGWIPIE